MIYLKCFPSFEKKKKITWVDPLFWENVALNVFENLNLLNCMMNFSTNQSKTTDYPLQNDPEVKRLDFVCGH